MNFRILLIGASALYFASLGGKNALAEEMSAPSVSTPVTAKTGIDLDRVGDRIKQRLDRRGDHIDAKFERRAIRARQRGHHRRADVLDHRGDRINARLDRRGNRIDARFDRRAERRKTIEGPVAPSDD